MEKKSSHQNSNNQKIDFDNIEGKHFREDLNHNNSVD